jgi:hypothetical protein
MSDRPAWCVKTMICSCDMVATTIYAADVLDDETWEDHLDGKPIDCDVPGAELALSGDDWRALMTEARD